MKFKGSRREDRLVACTLACFYNTSKGVKPSCKSNNNDRSSAERRLCSTAVKTTGKEQGVPAAAMGAAVSRIVRLGSALRMSKLVQAITHVHKVLHSFPIHSCAARQIKGQHLSVQQEQQSLLLWQRYSHSCFLPETIQQHVQGL